MKARIAKRGSVKGRQRTVAAAPAAAKRKGARRMSEIPPAVLRALNRGEEETITLVEFLAVDVRALVRHALRGAGLDAFVRPALAGVGRTLSQMETIALIGRNLFAAADAAGRVSEVREMLARHRSDTVRHFACMFVALDPRLTFAGKLRAIRPLAADPHMAVREMAWAALREEVARDPARAVRGLVSWTRSRDENLRRFASEATRPRGVWTRHIEELKRDPDLGLPVLEPLKSDPSRYVQNSVANWLNDASKSAPGWVRDVCRDWERRSPTDATRFIVRRALRTVRKGKRASA